jgi:MFS family permease
LPEPIDNRPDKVAARPGTWFSRAVTTQDHEAQAQPVRLYRWRDPAIVAAGWFALAAGFAQFGATAALGDVARTFGAPAAGASITAKVGLSTATLGVGLAIIRLASLGSLPLAGLADRRGRRPTLLGCVALGLALTATAAISPSFWWFVFIFALGRPLLSATNTIAGVIAAEETTSTNRAKAIALVTAGFGIGAGLTALLRGLFGSQLGFRGLFLLALVPLAITPLIAPRLKEPDRYRRLRADAAFGASTRTSETSGRAEGTTGTTGEAEGSAGADGQPEADSGLARGGAETGAAHGGAGGDAGHGGAGGDAGHGGAGTSATGGEADARLARGEARRWGAGVRMATRRTEGSIAAGSRSLGHIARLRPDLRARLGLLTVLTFAFSFVTGPANTFLFVYAENVLGMSRGTTALIVLAAGPIGLVGLLIGRWGADTFGRRRAAATSQAVVALAGIVTYSGAPGRIVVGYLLAILAASAYGPATATLVAELFPTSVRATIAGWLVAAGVLGAVAGLIVFGTISDVLNSFGLAAVVIGGPVLLASILFARLPETVGMELEQSAPESAPG